MACEPSLLCARRARLARRGLVAAALASGVATALAAPPAASAHAASRIEAKPKGPIIDVPKVEVPEGKDAWRIEQALRSYIKKAAKLADFGAAKRVVLKTRLVELRHEKRGDVVRIHCTILGKVDSGKSAKSRIRFGGRSEDAAKLEKQVLEMVAQGLVARLASIAREASSDYDSPDAGRSGELSELGGSSGPR